MKVIMQVFTTIELYSGDIAVGKQRDLEADVAMPLLIDKESNFGEGSTKAHCQYLRSRLPNPDLLEIEPMIKLTMQHQLRNLQF